MGFGFYEIASDNKQVGRNAATVTTRIFIVTVSSFGVKTFTFHLLGGWAPRTDVSGDRITPIYKPFI